MQNHTERNHIFQSSLFIPDPQSKRKLTFSDDFPGGEGGGIKREGGGGGGGGGGGAGGGGKTATEKK